jgi:hypothetical protein
MQDFLRTVVEDDLEIFYGSNRISFGILRGISNLISAECLQKNR